MKEKEKKENGITMTNPSWGCVNYWHRRGIYSGSVPYKDFGLKAPKYWLGQRPIYSQVYIQQEYYSRGGGGCRSRIYAPLENIYALYGFWTNFLVTTNFADFL